MLVTPVHDPPCILVPSRFLSRGVCMIVPQCWYLGQVFTIVQVSAPLTTSVCIQGEDSGRSIT